jgi:hypothetical protein
MATSDMTYIPSSMITLSLQILLVETRVKLYFIIIKQMKISKMTEELTEDLYCANVNITSIYYSNILFSNSTTKPYLSLHTEIVFLHSHYRFALKVILCFFPSFALVVQYSFPNKNGVGIKQNIRTPLPPH